MVTIIRIAFSRPKVCLELDNGNKFWLTKKDLSDSGLTEHMEMSEAEFQKTIRMYQYPHALNQAVAMLARRPCSRKEIERKLIYNRYDSDVIELVLYKLEKEKLIDDSDFCVQWIRFRAGQKYGPVRIRQELLQKGIDNKIISKLLYDQNTDNYKENLQLLAEKLWNHYSSDNDRYKTRQKVTASLVRKGYSWEQAKKACDLAEKNK